MDARKGISTRCQMPTLRLQLDAQRRTYARTASSQARRLRRDVTLVQAKPRLLINRSHSSALRVAFRVTRMLHGTQGRKGFGLGLACAYCDATTAPVMGVTRRVQVPSLVS